MRDSNYSKILPVEVWRECFVLLRLPEHKQLALTCRLFYNICLDFIFKSITYRSEIAFDSDHKRELISALDELNEYFGRFREMARNPGPALVVRRCSLVYSLDLDPEIDALVSKSAKEAYDTFVQAFVKAAPAFVNLREVCIDFQSQSISKRILKVLALLPNFEVFLSTNFRIGLHSLKPRLTLRRLIIDNSTGVDKAPVGPSISKDILDIFSSERLEHLEILSWVYSSPLLTSLANQGTLTHLVSLSFMLALSCLLEHRQIMALYLFLAKCPNLKAIRMDLNSLERDGPSSLPPLPRSAIPYLQTFHGPDVAAKVFIPGRPVQDVTLNYCKWARKIPLTQREPTLKGIVLSAVPITSLTIQKTESTAENLSLIKARFPYLKKLHLNVLYEELFPGQNPNDICLETVAKPYNSKSDNQPEKYLKSKFFHSAYMHLVHWIAHGKADLPPNLETLYLDTAVYKFGDIAIENLGRYSYSKACSVFEALSRRYPTLRDVLVGQDGTEDVCWSRGTGAKWAYFSEE